MIDLGVWMWIVPHHPLLPLQSFHHLSSAAYSPTLPIKVRFGQDLMAGYAAVVSLKQTIERILDSSRFSLLPPSPEIIRLACRQLKPLKTTLERLDSSNISKSRKKLNALDADIKVAVWKLEDVLETLLSDQILSQFQTSAADLLLFTIDLQSLQPHVDSFIKAVKDLEVKYIYELENMGELEEDELGRSSTNDSGGNMVGFSWLFEKVKNDLTERWDGNSVYSFLGMGGRGKTTLVKKIFEDSEVLRCFEYRVWVSVGRKSKFNEIADAILAQLDPNTYHVGAEDEVNIGVYLKKGLEGKRCLIVLDDVWDTQLLDCLTASLPEKNSAMIQILLTTRLPTVAEYTFNPGKLDFFGFLIQMPGLNEEESKELLRKKVFGEEDFPPQLREAAEKIASNCEGLPLMIVTVADLISKANKNDPLYWNEVAKRRSSVFMEAYNQISEVLFPTYDVLPQRVKMILISAGAFPEDDNIPMPYLTALLSAERFSELQNLENNVDQTLNEFGWKCDILALENYWFFETFRVYSWWRHLFNIEASKDKFLHVLTSGTDFLREGIKGQRGLCLYSNFIFNFKEVHNAVKCDCASTTRSLLCFGPYHRYSMPLDVGFKLLRVLEARKVRFYNFPFEILELVLLQYLALTCNRELPTSISKLFNLEFLIIDQHMHIKSCVAPSYMPIEIWDMQELKYIQINGSNLPNPNSASSLQKLSRLVVSPDNCTKEVFEKIPNLKVLSIVIELKPYVDDSNPLCCLDHISTLKNLEELGCHVTNPEVKYEFVAPPTPPSLSMFPSSLQKLSLRGLGYSWKHMKAIGSLPNLEVLTLFCNAFRGPKWGTKRKSFLSLKSLLIQDCDLEQWKPRCGSFPKLERLTISHCYKLKEVYWPSAAPCDGRIELDGCNPLAAVCAEQFKLRNKKHELQIISTFDEEDED